MRHLFDDLITAVLANPSTSNTEVSASVKNQCSKSRIQVDSACDPADPGLL